MYARRVDAHLGIAQNSDVSAILVIVMNLRDSDQQFAIQLHHMRTRIACAFLITVVVALLISPPPPGTQGEHLIAHSNKQMLTSHPF